MGISACFYAAEGDIDSIESALRNVWPEEVGGLVSEVRLEGNALELIYRNDDAVVLTLWQDGRYTGFASTNLCLFEEASLARLSAKAGIVLAVGIGDHGGSYMLDIYRAGRLVRSLNNNAEPRGEALLEEKGIDLSNLCEDQIAQIWSAFGLTDYYEGVAPFRAYTASASVQRRIPWSAVRGSTS